MIPTPLRDFVPKLLQATNAGQVKWCEADNLAYFCDQNGLTVHIRSWFDEGREQNFFFFRLEGRLGSTPFSVNQYEDEYNLMKDLYEAAIANANDVAGDVAKFFAP